MTGPFNNPPMFKSCRSCAKKKKDGTWSLITNLSATIGNSVNDFVDPALCILCLI